MKKLLSLFLYAVLLFALTLPAAAMTSYNELPLTDSELEEINRDYAKAYYEYLVIYNYEKRTFDEFYLEHSKPEDNFTHMIYYGRCENGAPILFLAFWGTFSMFECDVGNYHIYEGGECIYPVRPEDDKLNLDGTILEDVGGWVIYDNGKFISWEDAYSENILTDKELEEIHRTPPELVPNYGSKNYNPVKLTWTSDDGKIVKYYYKGRGMITKNTETGKITVGEETEDINQSTVSEILDVTDEPDISDEPDEVSDTGDNTAETEASISEEASADTAETEDENTPSVNVTRTVVKTMDKGLTTALIIAGSAAALIAAAVVVILIVRKKKAKAGE